VTGIEWSDAFFKSALPRLGLRWQGFRKVHRQVTKRLKRRLQVLHLEDLSAYALYLERHPEEWAIFESFCRVTISRFYRDREVFETLRTDVLPRLARYARARHEQTLRCWSAGCASGEEPYTLTMLWQLCLSPQFPEMSLRLIATDVDPHLLERARKGWYTHSSVREFPAEWIARGFERLDNGYRVRDVFREAVCFVEQDIRHALPSGPWHLILCRNLVFTYFSRAVQRDILARMVAQLAPGGILVVGKHEALPPGNYDLRPYAAQQGLFQKGAG
jgi:chemotaxis protein methyltransferase CheR